MIGVIFVQYTKFNEMNYCYKYTLDEVRTMLAQMRIEMNSKLRAYNKSKDESYGFTSAELRDLNPMLTHKMINALVWFGFILNVGGKQNNSRYVWTAIKMSHNDLVVFHRYVISLPVDNHKWYADLKNACRSIEGKRKSDIKDTLKDFGFTERLDVLQYFLFYYDVINLNNKLVVNLNNGWGSKLNHILTEYDNGEHIKEVFRKGKSAKLPTFKFTRPKAPKSKTAGDTFDEVITSCSNMMGHDFRTNIDYKVPLSNPTNYAKLLLLKKQFVIENYKLFGLPKDVAIKESDEKYNLTDYAKKLFVVENYKLSDLPKDEVVIKKDKKNRKIICWFKKVYLYLLKITE